MHWSHIVIYILILILTVWATTIHIMMSNYNKEYSCKEYFVSKMWYEYLTTVSVLIVADIIIWIK